MEQALRNGTTRLGLPFLLFFLYIWLVFFFLEGVFCMRWVGGPKVLLIRCIFCTAVLQQQVLEFLEREQTTQKNACFCLLDYRTTPKMRVFVSGVHEVSFYCYCPVPSAIDPGAHQN